jgi:DNA (cytosine-5)-methyltransferase 1
MSVPIIDLFAGPGGLGEGFSQVGWKEGYPFFRIGLSVESDFAAYRTLKLRSFFRKFPFGEAPLEYYEFLRKGRAPEDLYKLKKYAEQVDAASREAWCAELGSGAEFDELLDRKIEQILQDNPNWVLIGGPPCQAYSIVGRSRNKGVKNYIPEEDDRHFLYQEYLRIIAQHKPAIFVMENVKGILSSKVNGNKIFERILSDLKNPLGMPGCKYRIFSLIKEPQSFASDGNPEFKKEDFIIESEKYGIPQARHRVILLGVRENFCRYDIIPGVLKEKEVISSYKVLGLPRLRSGISRGKYDENDWKRAVLSFPIDKVRKEVGRIANGRVLEAIWRALQSISLPREGMGAEFVSKVPNNIPDEILANWFEDSRLEGIFNYSARTHMVTDLHRYLYAACFAKEMFRSPKLHEFPDVLKPDHKNRDTGHFDDRFRVQLSGRPSCTITSHISKDGHYYIHFDPTQCRSLTVREAARLQTFPDNYYFCGNRTEQYVQVGNAVPPFLAFQIAMIVKNLLLTAIDRISEQRNEVCLGEAFCRAS